MLLWLFHRRIHLEVLHLFCLSVVVFVDVMDSFVDVPVVLLLLPLIVDAIHCTLFVALIDTWHE